MRKRIRAVFWGIMCVFCLTLSGCVRVSQTMVINEDGSVDTVYTILGQNGVGMDDIKNVFQKAGLTNLRIAQKAAPGWQGYDAGVHDENIEGFLRRLPSLQEFELKDYYVKRRTGWLYDAYAFNLSLPSENREKIKNKANESKAADQSGYEFTLKLPYASESHNADKVTGDGKTLTWDLAAAVTRDKDYPGAHVSFRIWHQLSIATFAAVLVVLAFLAYRAWRRGQTGGKESAKEKNLAFVFGALLVVGLGWGGYTVIQFPVLTEADVIGRTSMVAATGGKTQETKSTKPESEKSEATKATINSSEVTTETIELPKAKLEYPVIHLKNKAAEMAINQDIKAIVDHFVSHSVTGKNYLKKASVFYDVCGNQTDFISIVLTERIANEGAPHSNDKVHGLVYDKRTGERRPLDFFLRLTKEEILSEAETEFYTYRNRNKEPQPFNRSQASFEKIPKDCFLDNQGNLFVLFQKYQMAAGVAGPTCVRFTPARVLALRKQ